MTNASIEVPIPVKLDLETRECVLSAYEQALGDLGKDEERYVKSKLPRVVKRLRGQGEWLAELAALAEALALTYFEEPGQQRRLRDDGRRQILAALFYLCNPYDVIPDFDPQRGYADDALVMNRCISTIRKNSADMYCNSVLKNHSGRRRK